MTDGLRPRVSRAARLLGYAGLLPQIGAALLTIAGGPDWTAYGAVLAFGYAALILSFLGGIWWGLATSHAMKRGWLFVLAVAPSLFAFAVLIAMLVAGKAGIFAEFYYGWALTALGVGLIATLPVDAHLEANGDAPSGWFRLRSVLSLCLGLLTIATGAWYAANVVTIIHA